MTDRKKRKMKVLLVTPGEPSSPVVPDLGAGYLASALRKAGHEVSFLDGLKVKLTAGRIGRHCRGFGASAVGLKIFSSFLRQSAETAKIVRSLLPNVLLFAGGPHPSCDPGGILASIPELDFAVAGEGEETLPAAIEAFPDLTGLRKIPNLVFRSGNGIILTPGKTVADLDSLSWPAWDLIDPRSYPPAPQGLFLKSHPAGRMIATRGCPNDCGFCSVSLLNGRRVRTRDPLDIREEIRFLHDRMGVREIHFSDDNFTASRKFALEACAGIAGLPFRIHWAVPQGIRLDTLDRELLAEMKRSGCYGVGVGLESGSPAILKKMGKKESLGMMREKVGLLSRAGIRTLGYFIVGYPEETEEDVKRTIEFSRSLPLDSAAFSIFQPFAGTRVHDELKKSGIPGGPEKFGGDYDFAERAVPPWTPGRLVLLKRKALIGFYSRFSALFRFVKGINLAVQIPWLASRIVKTFCRKRPSPSPRDSFS